MGSKGLLSDTLNKTVKHSFIYGLGTSFAAVSGIILIPIYTRFLSPGDYGVYALISIVFGLLFFLYDFGMVNALFRWYYQYGAVETALRRRVVNTTLLFSSCLAMLFTSILWNNAPLISRFLFSDERYSWLIKLMLLGVLLQSLTWVPLAVLRIRQKVMTFTSIVIVGMLLMITANCLFLSSGRGVNGIYEAYIAAYAFMVAALFVITRREYSLDCSFTELKGMLKFGLPYIPVLFFSWAIDFSDRYLLGRLSTLDQVGIYSVGYRIGQAMYLAEKTFLIAWGPLMLSLFQEHRSMAQEIFGKVFTYFTLVIFFLCLSISVFSREIIQIFTSPAYYGAAKVIPVIAFSYLLNGIYIFMLSGLIISKNVSVQPVILLIAAAANIALNIFLIPRYGMMGSAYATVFSYMAVAAATFFYAQKFYPIRIEAHRLGKIIVAAALIFIVSCFVRFGNLGSSLAVKSVLIGVFFLILYKMNFFHKTELDKLKNIISGIKRPSHA